MELCFLRDNHKREVDFVVLRDGKPIFAVECKVGEKSISKHVSYFAKRTEVPIFYQVHMGKEDYEVTDLRTRIIPFTKFASEVLKV